jgi:hypothetical protein
MRQRFTYVLLIFVIIICCSTVPNYRYEKACSQEENTILWSNDRKLRWEDFKGVPDTSHSVLVTVAGTTSVINFEYKTAKSMITSYNIEAIFIKNKSWTITSDIQTLEHEQLHFDITELYARKIRKTFDSLRSRKNYIEDNYVKVYNRNIMEKNELDDLYDNQVYGNYINQNKWIKKISNEVLKLKKYEYLPEN